MEEVKRGTTPYSDQEEDYKQHLNSEIKEQEEEDGYAEVQAYKMDRKKQQKKEFDKSKMFNRVAREDNIRKRELIDDSESYHNNNGQADGGEGGVQSVSDNTHRDNMQQPMSYR